MSHDWGEALRAKTRPDEHETISGYATGRPQRLWQKPSRFVAADSRGFDDGARWSTRHKTPQAIRCDIALTRHPPHSILRTFSQVLVGPELRTSGLHREDDQMEDSNGNRKIQTHVTTSQSEDATYGLRCQTGL
jgi:hypothetical protein